MSTTIILGSVIGILLIVIIFLIVSGGKDDDESDIPEHIPPNQDMNSTFAPNTVMNQTAPLEKGKKKKKNKVPVEDNEAVMGQAGKDETFLPQTSTTPNEEDPNEDDALTGAQPKN